MNLIRKTILPIFLATVWISISEFVRNEFIVKSYWVSHFQDLGIPFPSAPFNGAVWGLWSLLLALTIFFLTKKFSVLETVLLSWLTGFVMMWVVIGNLGVLPYGILLMAIPLSLLECWLATWIIVKFQAKDAG